MSGGKSGKPWGVMKCISHHLPPSPTTARHLQPQLATTRYHSPPLRIDFIQDIAPPCTTTPCAVPLSPRLFPFAYMVSACAAGVVSACTTPAYSPWHSQAAMELERARWADVEAKASRSEATHARRERELAVCNGERTEMEAQVSSEPGMMY